jgi:hypothetical protein
MGESSDHGAHDGAGPTRRRRARHAVSRRAEALGWWGRLVATVLTAGALAGAVTAISKLIDDPQDRAEITAGDVTAPVRLTEHVDSTRIGPARDSSSLGTVVLRAAVAPTRTAAPSGSVRPSATPSTTTSASASPSATPRASATPSQVSPTPQSPSPSPSPSTTVLPFQSSRPSAALQDVKVLPPPRTTPEERNANRLEVQAHSALQQYLLPSEEPAEDPKLIQKAESFPLEDTELVDAEGDPVPPAVAAEALAARLADVRSAPQGGRLDLVGARARVDLVLEGLEGEPVLLYWQLLPAGATSLPAGWWGATPSHRITATTASDTGTVTPWVPLPEAPGPYKLELLLVLEEGLVPLDSVTTGPFAD